MIALAATVPLNNICQIRILSALVPENLLSRKHSKGQLTYSINGDAFRFLTKQFCK